MSKIELHNVDCMELMKKTPDNYYELSICDPPYGINVAKMAYTQEDNKPVKQKNGKILRVKKIKYKLGAWDKTPPPEEYFKELFRISKNQIIWGIKHYSLKGLGSGLITWNKCVPEGVSFNNYEHAYCSLLDKEIEFTYLWAGMFQGKSLSEPTIQQGNKKLNEKRIHPTQKPVKLYRWLLINYAKEGDKILDTHLGSGSHAIACHDLGFDLTACEIDKDYFEAARKRLKTHKMQLKLF
jgi:site-specific DNA-methyltransferase (adenine-specific)